MRELLKEMPLNPVRAGRRLGDEPARPLERSLDAPGNSAISGAIRGKQELGANWAKLAEKGFTTTPQYWFADEERVVVLTQITVAGEKADSADVLTFNSDAKLVKFQTAGDTALFERVFGPK